MPRSSCSAVQCPKCDRETDSDVHLCAHCGATLAIAVLEVTRGNLAERIHFLKPCSYSLGRARHNELCLIEPSISKHHARIEYEDGRFSIVDLDSRHGVYVDAARTERAELTDACVVQLGNVILRYSSMSTAGTSTDSIRELPWIEQQQLLLSLVQTLNATLDLRQVLEQVLDAVMRITRAERGFLLLADPSPENSAEDAVAGLRVRLGRHKDGRPLTAQEVSTSVIRRTLESGVTVATGNAAADPELGEAESVVEMDLRTIVCIPLRSLRAELAGDEEGPQAMGAIYVDNRDSSAPFSSESLRTAEALARHASLAIENAQLFEREKQANEDLRIAQRQVLHSERLATIGQMAAGIAHELNTPLTYIMGNIELLQSKESDPARAGMLRSLAGGADRIKRLVQSLLAFSRSSEEELLPISPNDVIDRSLELCHYQLVKAHVNVDKALAPSLPQVLGVANQLEMALINLIVNAVQAMDPGGQLRVASASTDAEVEITLADSGPGIPRSVQPKIFEPFFTTKPKGSGTGLGLSTVQMVIDRHKGRLEFSSEEGQGTTFKLFLRTCESQPAKPTAE